MTARRRAALDRLVRRASTPQRLALRAQILLAAAAGERNEALARRLGCTPTMARKWRRRWAAAEADLAAAEAGDDRHLARVLTRLLADASRPGAPGHFAPEQIVQVVAVACEPPPGSDRPTSHWTPRELAAEAVKRGIVAAISPRTVGRFLGSGRPQAASEPLLADAQAGRPSPVRRAGGDSL
jgi:putative transposase